VSELSGQQLVAVSNSILLRSEVLAVLDTGRVLLAVLEPVPRVALVVVFFIS